MVLGAIPKLAARVLSPAEEGRRGTQDPARVDLTGSDGCPGSAAVDGCRRRIRIPICGAASQLALIIRTPAVALVSVRDRARVGVTSGYRFPTAYTTDICKGWRGVRAVCRLPVATVPPTVENAPGCHRAGVVGSQRHSFPSDGPRTVWLGRDCPTHRRLVAKLAVIVRSPAIQAISSGNSARVLIIF